LFSVFEDLIRASHVNFVYSLPAGFGIQMNFQAALWSRLGTSSSYNPNRLGNCNLSSMYTEIFLHNYGDSAMMEDVVAAYCVKALQVHITRYYRH
jgi:hypothetical protein